jgi:hypothetical protein
LIRSTVSEEMTHSGLRAAAKGEDNTTFSSRHGSATSFVASVELDGIEPTTSGLQSQRSPN